MSILIGLAVATVLMIGWSLGNIFVCVFLTLGGLTICALLGAGSTAKLEFLGITALLIVITWTPFLIKRIKSAQTKRRDDRPTISLASRSDDIVGGVLTVLTFLGVGWMFLHDMADTWSLVSSRPFLTMVGFAALFGLGLGWANRAV